MKGPQAATVLFHRMCVAITVTVCSNDLVMLGHLECVGRPWLCFKIIMIAPTKRISRYMGFVLLNRYMVFSQQILSQ